MITFQELIAQLSNFWAKEGCSIHQGYDLETGAGTFNPVTFLRCLGPEPYYAAYVEPSRRPTDGRYGTNPNRVQHFHQYQVILKPSPPDIQTVYLRSLKAVGLDLSKHDIRFVHDDWESPTLGAWGLGWETWIDGQEVSQITYFQSVAGLELKPITGEITYGLERLAMYLQGVDTIFDLQWNERLTYGEVFLRNEIEWSAYNFEKANTAMWFQHFNDFEKEAEALVKEGLPIPAYDFVAKASHAFNLLDARGVISVTERTGYIGRIRDLAKKVAEGYIESRKKINFPLLKKFPPTAPPAQEISEIPSFPIEEKKTFLLEIGSEELPASFVAKGLQSLEKLMKNLLDTEGVSYGKFTTHGTPRRLAIIIEDLACGVPAVKEERRGPPLNRIYDAQNILTEAGAGFFRSVGMDPPTLEQLVQGGCANTSIKSIKGVDYLFVDFLKKSLSTAHLLAERLPQLIGSIDFPKKMRWAHLDVTYARPVLWLIAMMDDRLIPFIFGEVATSNQSSGHRQLSFISFPIDHAKNYVDELRHHRVMVQIEERKKSIEDQLHQLEKNNQLQILEKERVLPEVLQLVEWPFVTWAAFEEKFLSAPSELLISEMVEHQRYFPAADSSGSLANFFIITANNTPTEQIKQGNCNVLSARLQDGVFLYEQDLKTPLADFNEKLKHITFQKDLGTLHDKVERLIAHAKKITAYIPLDNSQPLLQAASLCKADLASQVVYEFPQLQGIMGRYYALNQGENSETAQAIQEHWMPLSEKSPLPESLAGSLLSISDKLDNLLSCFATGLKPSSSSDPYALRRQVLGLIRILLQQRLHLPLKQLLQECLSHFPKAWQDQKVVDEILDFITNRLRTVFQDYNFKKDEIEASISFGFNDIYDTFCRIQALHAFRNTSAFAPLYQAFRRAKGQIENFERDEVNADLFEENAEKNLYNKFKELQVTLLNTIHARDYDESYRLLAEIQPTLAKMFDEVRILAEEENIKKNRIALLQAVFSLFEQLLDFNQLQEKVVQGKG